MKCGRTMVAFAAVTSACSRSSSLSHVWLIRHEWHVTIGLGSLVKALDWPMYLKPDQQGRAMTGTWTPVWSATTATREEIQGLLDHADAQVDVALRRGNKGALVRCRGATVFKVLYASEVSALDVTDFRPHEAAPERRGRLGTKGDRGAGSGPTGTLSGRTRR
ncbi:hypothetical protein SAMN05444920_102200 [Nonomuraea solani]|uniref:Uncharacterized protein n=1 Tax=Nonomuraea solani TaxID=1144553 RepID=A0A1H5YBN3_9ACTN|nr:hypothetical protein SAMN05444920_102200 [Nonomuraea solani]